MATEAAKPKSYVHTIKQELIGVAVFVGVIWLVFLLSCLFPFIQDRLALIPRYLTRLLGIPAMPFLHKDLAHIASNTIPLFVLLTLLAGSRARSSLIVAWLILSSGVLLWLLGRNGTPAAPVSHIGASGLVFGLVTFHCAAGILERRPLPILIAIVVGFLYGGMLLWEVLLPFLSTNDRVSWEGHIFGAIAGVVVAVIWTRDRAQPLREAIPAFKRMANRAWSIGKIVGPSVASDQSEPPGS